MKVGILTLHYGCNYGALLQAYATAQLFKGTIVDHRYVSKGAVHRSGMDRRPHLGEFLHDKLPLSSYSSLAADFKQADTFRYIDEQYDLLVCGSDELWKVDYQSAPSLSRWMRDFVKHPVGTAWNAAHRQRNAWCTPFPNVYWPTVSIPVVGFAASVGESKLSQIPRLHRRRMCVCLERFALIGVRDCATESFVTQLSASLSDRIERVPDPVFTMSSERRVLESAFEKLESAGVRPSDDMAFVHLDKSNPEAFIRELRHEGFRPINLVDFPLSPLEWLAVIGECQCGVTDAMHPLICSLTSNVPCWSIDRRNKSQELREEFNIDGYCKMRECLDSWPGSIPAQADEYRRRVLDFVDKARRLVPVASGAADDASARREERMVGCAAQP